MTKAEELEKIAKVLRIAEKKLKKLLLKSKGKLSNDDRKVTVATVEIAAYVALIQLHTVEGMTVIITRLAKELEDEGLLE